MNRISVIISASIIIICLISCDSTQSADRIDESRATTIKIATNNGTPDLDSIVRNHKFTRLETSEECLVGEVYKLSCRNKKYYILDRHLQKALFVFDEEGKFRNRIGRRGRGPGEFIEPTDFIVSDSTVTVFDMFGHKLLYYNPDGTFIRSVRLPYSIYEIESGGDGSAIYAVGGDNSKCDSLKNYELLEIGPEGDIRAKVYKNKYSMDFSNKYDLQGFDEDVIYKKAFRPAVYMLRDKNLYAKYIFDIPSHALPGDYEKLCRGGEFRKVYKTIQGRIHLFQRSILGDRPLCRNRHHGQTHALPGGLRQGYAPYRIGTGRYHVRGKRARQERTVRHGNERPGRRGREPDYRCARPNQVIPRHASGIVRPTGGNRLCQSGDRHIGFDALSYSSAPSSGSTKPIFRFQPKPTRMNSPPGFRWQARARCGI